MADLTAGGVPVYRDSAGVLRETKGADEMAAIQAQMDALAASVPVVSTATPLSEKTGGDAGVEGMMVSGAGHQHPRLTSTTYAILNASGQAVVPFTRPFTNKPGLNLTETDATPSTQPLVLRAIGWQRDADNLYTGVTVQGLRAQMLPQVAVVSGLLTTVITGVNTLVGQLTGYNVFGGSAAGASVSVIAVARSDVSAV